MGERDLTKKYFAVLGDIYKDEGLFGVIEHEIRSTAYSLGKRLGNILDIKPPKYRRSSGGKEDRNPPEGGQFISEDYNEWRINQKKRTEDRENYILKRKKRSLDSKAEAMTFSIISLLGSIIFLSPVFTGNTISNLNQYSTEWIGVFLFLVSLIAGFFWFKKK